MLVVMNNASHSDGIQIVIRNKMTCSSVFVQIFVDDRPQQNMLQMGYITYIDQKNPGYVIIFLK